MFYLGQVSECRPSGSQEKLVRERQKQDREGKRAMSGKVSRGWLQLGLSGGLWSVSHL